MESVSNFVSTASNAQENQNEINAEDKFTFTPSVKEVYRCPYKDCNFSSTWKASLNNHIKTHTDERPWECALCNKHFRLKHHLKHHILTHSQNKPFKCNLCDYRSNDVQSLQRHRVNKHKFPVKRKTVSKALSLPTMVSLASQSPLSNSPFLNSIVPRTQASSFDGSLTDSFSNSRLHSVVTSQQTSSLPSNTLSSISEALMKRQQFLLNASHEKIAANKSTSSESCGLFFPQTTISSQSETARVEADHEASATDNQSITSVQSVFGGKDVKSTLDLKPTFWSVSTPSSQKSSDCVVNGRTSVDSLNTKSPSPNNSKNFPENFAEHFSFFDQNADNDKSVCVNNSLHRNYLPKVSSPDLWKCSHCSIIFPDNIMYGLHMGCHTVGKPFQCNVCGKKCKDSHDFMFHFTIGSPHSK